MTIQFTGGADPEVAAAGLLVNQLV